MKRAVVCVSDLHIGSFAGLCPREGIKLDNGAVQLPSKYQQYLVDCWDHFWKTFVVRTTKGCKDVTVVINGDAIDGNHHQAVDLVANLETQERTAVEMLRDITRKYRTFMVRGTEAHGGKSDQNTESIARQIGCELDESGANSVWQLWLDVNGVVFQFAHHIGTTSSAAYETSAPMREMVAGLVESVQWEQRLPDVFVRSHRHRYITVPLPREGNRDIQLTVTPGWQLRTPHVERIDRMRLPHIGGVIFIVEDKTWRTERMLYQMPKPAIVRI